MRSPVMLFRPGSETIIWDIHLDTIIVDEHEVPDYLASGWYSHPWEARDSISAVKLETYLIGDSVMVGDQKMVVTEVLPDSGITPAIIDKPRRGRPPKAKETP